MSLLSRRKSTAGWLLGALLLAAVPLAQAGSIGASLTTTEKRQLEREARLVVDLLQNYHYSGGSFREIENKEMVTHFLAEFDPTNDFLTEGDAEFLHRRFDHSLKPVYLQRGDLQPAFEIFDLFSTRARERLDWIDRRLAQDFDFTVDESYVETRPPELPKENLSPDRRWELRLKDEILEEMLAGRDLAGAKEVMARRYAEIRRQIAAVDSLAVRERFFDSVIRLFDPHSGYFSADSAREFAVGMENAVAGVGLELRKENGQCVVTAVQPGGPADLLTEIQPDDIIDELGDAGGPQVDASRRPLRELVALVRGESGTKLRIAFHAPGSPGRTEVTLTRARVLLDAERAHAAISLVPAKTGAGRKIGWITLPSFYAAGEGANASSATRDVQELLDQMVAGGIDGLVFDLRGNPGGALSEAVAMSGLFVKSGLVMVSRRMDGPPTIFLIKEAGAVYAGPLVILTSSQSASASEIFAGAMKFHHRAVIVGAKSTFGKGTMQNYIELARTQAGLPGKETVNWGTLRLTSERFFLPDGGAVQREGVTSQIVLADDDEESGSREADLPRALPAESTTLPDGPSKPAEGAPAVIPALVDHLRETAEADVRGLPEWTLWQDERRSWKLRADRRIFSLLLDARKAEWLKLRAERLARIHTRRELAALAAFTTTSEELALLHPALVAHQEKLRAGKGEDGQPLLYRLHHGSFIVQTGGGRLRSIRMQLFRFEDFAGDGSELAKAFSAGTGSNAVVEPRDIELVLEDLDLLEHRTDDAVLDCFSKRFAGLKLDPAGLRQGVDGLLRRAVEINGELLRERPGLDVPLRECLRLAGEWADWGSHNPPAATAP